MDAIISADLPLGANGSRRRGTRPHGLAAGKPLPDFIKSRPANGVAQLAEQVVRERHAFEHRSRFELAMQIGRYVSDLNRHGHPISILTCKEIIANRNQLAARATE
jgi:hypothetical protein